MTALYRLYTEDKPNLTDIVSAWFTGASLFMVTGLYAGVTERGAVIEILGTDSATDRACVHGLAREIIVTNQQTEVLILTHASAGLTSERVTR